MSCIAVLSRLVRAVPFVAALVLVSGSLDAVEGRQSLQGRARVAVDFNDVDLPVFVRFISELTGKNFVLDDKIKGKVTVYSPTKVNVNEAYNMFLATLEVQRLAAVPKGRVIQIVRVAEVPPERSVYVYKLKHANAKDTVAVLTNLVARSQAASPGPGGQAALRPGGEFDGPVQVFADTATNALLISGTRTSYERLSSVIEQLDTPRRQVFLEAVIMEVSMSRLREVGTDPVAILAVGESGSLRGIGGFNTAPDVDAISAFALALAGGATGGALPILNTVNATAFIQLMMTLTDTNILSTPQVLASDNEKARIVVGENVPFPTGQAQGITGGTIVTIERKDVGVQLEMTPQVLEGDRVRLAVKQELTAVQENQAQTIGTGETELAVGPTLTKRSTETVAVARDGQTIVVGGLVREDLIVNVNKIPLLGDIPFLGWLFKSENKRTVKFNLLVFLTPHLIKDEADLVRLNTNKGKEIEALRGQSGGVETPIIQQEINEKLLLNSQANPPPGTQDARP